MTPLTWNLTLLSLLVPTVTLQTALAAEDPEEARNRLLDYLKTIHAPTNAVRITPLNDKDFLSIFPNHTLFSVGFPQYPVARIAPKPLQPSNLIAIATDNKNAPVLPITTLEQWRDFVSRHGATVRDARAAEQVARVYVRGAAELHQDGFFRFTIEVEPARLLPDKANTIRVQGQAKVEPKNGDRGSIQVALTLTDGRLTQAQHQVQISAGIRPICQATRLVDPDPVIRRMAEDALRVLGHDALPYLEEQRQRASPQLREAIDRLWQRILQEDR
jgi:hypothetical protein